MRKLVTWLLVTLGIAALVRKLRRREEERAEITPGPPAPAAPTEDPAEELRRKLDQSRAGDEAGSVEERRADVHEQGRATLQEMQPSDTPSEGSSESQSQER